MNQYYTTIPVNDGFGSQYQKKIQTYIYCKIHGLNYAYDTLNYVEHNYTNDTEYNSRLESLMNLKDNIININGNMKYEYLDYGTIVMKYFEENIDLCCESEHMRFIKDCFWKNKDKNYFNNYRLNVAVHIRRENSHDRGQAGDRATTHNNYYLTIMDYLREKYKNRDILFHIYSQGDLDKFKDLTNDDVKFYLDYDIVESFIGMVAADVLIISPSSLSYVAALLSDGEIYYKKFWHNPKKDWIICNPILI